MLGSIYILAVLNMVIFIVSFFMLMNKKGYIYQYKFESRYIFTSVFLIFTIIMGLGFGETSIQQMLRMFLTTYLTCKIFYEVNTRKSIVMSLIYSLVYILVGCSIYWFVQISVIKLNYILEITLLGSAIIFFTSIYFFNRLEDIYKKINIIYTLH